jgi:hypothetical protein
MANHRDIRQWLLAVPLTSSGMGLTGNLPLPRARRAILRELAIVIGFVVSLSVISSSGNALR